MARHIITLEDQLKLRLEELKTELESAHGALATLERREFEHRQTLLRISGAIQVLEEELMKGRGTHLAAVSEKSSVANSKRENTNHSDAYDALHPGAIISGIG